jgi:hypothetical protein
VRILYYRVRAKFVEMGFAVHKEEVGPCITALGLRIGQLDAETKSKGAYGDEDVPTTMRVLLRPTEEKRAVMVQGTSALLRQGKAPIAWMMTVQAIWTYHMLINRPLQSIWLETCKFLNPRRRVPRWLRFGTGRCLGFGLWCFWAALLLTTACNGGWTTSSRRST